MDVWAKKLIKGKEVKQRFSKHGWDLLGNDKNGWSEVKGDSIMNTFKKTLKPGEKEQPIANTIVKDKPVEKPQAPVQQPSLNKKEEFMKAIEGFNKGLIKDYFDELEPPVKYENKAGLPALKEQLGEHFKYDVVELQKAFSL